MTKPQTQIGTNFKTRIAREKKSKTKTVRKKAHIVTEHKS